MNIAIIPARGGSRRIKNKNSKIFFGKPIISYAISTALNSKIFKEVIVSTNESKIARISKISGAKTYFKRPKYLSKNNVPIIDVISYVLKKLEKQRVKPKYVCCIFPISPMIKKNLLNDGLQILKEKKYDYVISVTKKTYSNQNKLYAMKNKISKNVKKSKVFYDAGQFCWGKSEAWKKKSKIFGTNSGIKILNSKKFIDVNYPKDWEILKKNFLHEKRK